MRADTLRKIAVFGLVGIGASLIHLGVTAFVNKALLWSILLANQIGYAIGFVWSYSGHYYLTFRSSKRHGQALPRFALTALIGYGINNGVLVACVLITGDESLWFVALAIAMAAGVVYLLSNFWALGGKT